MTDLAPIILFVYDRPEHTRNTLKHLSSNPLSRESDLFIFADGAKSTVNEDQLKNIDLVRAIIREKKWCGNVHIIESDVNKGLSKSVIEGVTQIVNKFGKVIVLEDDIEVSATFLSFMNNALNKYEDEENVISISGWMYPVEGLPETIFLKGADCWAWGTWKRGWDLFESDGEKLMKIMVERKLQREFDYNGGYHYTKMLQDQIDGKNDSWGIRWMASAYVENRLTLYPGKSLIRNTGMDGSGTHCTEDEMVIIRQLSTLSDFNKNPVIENKEARQLLEQFFKSYIKEKSWNDQVSYYMHRIKNLFMA